MEQIVEETIPAASTNGIFFLLQHNFYAVMHCAGLKAVGESIEIPLEYYQNNVTGTIYLLQVGKGIIIYIKLIFSSSKVLCQGWTENPKP